MAPCGFSVGRIQRRLEAPVGKVVHISVLCYEDIIVPVLQVGAMFPTTLDAVDTTPPSPGMAAALRRELKHVISSRA